MRRTRILSAPYGSRPAANRDAVRALQRPGANDVDNHRQSTDGTEGFDYTYLLHLECIPDSSLGMYRSTSAESLDLVSKRTASWKVVAPPKVLY